MRPFLLAALTLVPFAARAQDGPPPGVVTLEVLPGWRAAEGRHVAGLRLRLAPGWKTYWRAPGTAGLAPLIGFGASEGVSGAEVEWPVPEVFASGGMRSIGYAGEVTLPVEVDVAGDGPARLAGEVEIGVCHEVCVPVRMRFSAELPAAGTRDPALVAALVDRPATAEEAGATAACAVAPAAQGVGLTVRLTMPSLGPDEAVVIESADPGLWVSEPVARREGAALVATAEVLARDGGPVAIDRSGLRVTVLGDGRAVDIRGCGAG